MTLVTRIICNGCGTAREGEPQKDWTRRSFQDFCPKCTARRAEFHDNERDLARTARGLIDWIDTYGVDTCGPEAGRDGWLNQLRAAVAKYDREDLRL